MSAFDVPHVTKSITSGMPLLLSDIVEEVNGCYNTNLVICDVREWHFCKDYIMCPRCIQHVIFLVWSKGHKVYERLSICYQHTARTSVRLILNFNNHAIMLPQSWFTVGCYLPFVDIVRKFPNTTDRLKSHNRKKHTCEMYLNC